MFSPITLALWGINILVKLALVMLCWRTDYRAFRLYVLATFSKSLLLWCCSISGALGAYFWTYHVGLAVETVTLFMAIVELAGFLFFPLEILPQDVFKRGVRLLTLMLVILWSGAAVFHSSSPITRYAIARTIDLIETGTLLVLLTAVITVSRYLRIVWRKRAAWVASGLTFYLSISLAHSMKVLHRALPGLETVHSNMFLIAGLIWAMGFLAKDTVMEIPSIEVLRKAVEIAEQIELESIPRKRCASVSLDSLIPTSHSQKRVKG